MVRYDGPLSGRWVWAGVGVLLLLLVTFLITKVIGEWPGYQSWEPGAPLTKQTEDRFLHAWITLTVLLGWAGRRFWMSLPNRLAGLRDWYAQRRQPR